MNTTVAIPASKGFECSEKSLLVRLPVQFERLSVSALVGAFTEDSGPLPRPEYVTASPHGTWRRVPEEGTRVDGLHTAELPEGALDHSLKCTSDKISFTLARAEQLYVASGTTVGQLGLADKRSSDSGLKVVKSLNIARDLNAAERTKGVLLVRTTSDSNVLVVTLNSLRIIDRDLSRTVGVLRFDTERFTNDTVLDDTGGIYVTSNKFVRKIIWTGSRLSPFKCDGSWCVPCDIGDGPVVDELAELLLVSGSGLK